MERTEKPWERDGEEREEKVEELSGVYFDSEKVEKVEVESKVEEEKSVYFDSEKDSNLHSDNNGKGFSQGRVVIEDTPTTKALEFENGSGSNSKPYTPQFTTREKEGSTSNTIVNIKELDLAKFLEEQETHDLYCPDCNSCITRRVILEKRKRIAKNVKSDSRPEKHPNLGQIETTNENLDEREETNVFFKCLSCFSVVIPTDCGFDVFHLFGGKKESIQTPSNLNQTNNLKLKGSYGGNTTGGNWYNESWWGNVITSFGNRGGVKKGGA